METSSLDTNNMSYEILQSNISLTEIEVLIYR